MKILLLAFISVLVASCGNNVEGISGVSKNQEWVTENSVFIVYPSIASKDLYDFKKGKDNTFDLDCGSMVNASEQRTCVENSLKVAVKYSFELCVIDPAIPDSALLRQAKSNCKILE